MGKRWVRVCALVGSVIVVIGTATAATVAAAASPGSTGGVKPNHLGMMDCNGHSPVYQDVKQDMGGGCTDPLGYWDGKSWRFKDNGVYVGHDEPSVKFISSAPGSGNNMSYVMRLSTDPKGKPTVSPTGKTSDYAQLSPAPWFGLPICDAKSYPQNPCTPDSDANSGVISDPNAAGSAFLELQFYPPGYQPFTDAISCDATHWCAALTIDSLECSFNFATCNNNCIEPVNFAYMQQNGVPAGPPSPQLTDVSTFTPNRETLLMNPGDTVTTSLRDTESGVASQRHRSEYPKNRVHGGECPERVHEHEHRRLHRHAVQLPPRVQHGQAAEPGAVGRTRGRSAHGAGDGALRDLRLPHQLLPDQ